VSFEISEEDSDQEYESRPQNIEHDSRFLHLKEDYDSKNYRHLGSHHISGDLSLHADRIDEEYSKRFNSVRF